MIDPWIWTANWKSENGSRGDIAVEIRKHILAGWELWCLANHQYPRLPGTWELRYKAESMKISWDAIERLRRIRSK